MRHLGLIKVKCWFFFLQVCTRKRRTNQNTTRKDHWNTKMYSRTTWWEIFTTGWHNWKTGKTQWKKRKTKTTVESKGIRTWRN